MSATSGKVMQTETRCSESPKRTQLQQWMYVNRKDLVPTSPKKTETHQHVYTGDLQIPHKLKHIVRVSNRSFVLN
jgi:hypothetical protein